MECTNEERYSYEYEYVYDNQFGYIYNQIVDSVRSPNIEICRDNVESKKDYVDYIEDELDFDCVNDFGN